MSNIILEESYSDELPVLTTKQKAELIAKYVECKLREYDFEQALNVDIGFALRSMVGKIRYFPPKEELKTLAPFIIATAPNTEELITYIFSFLVTACEPDDFTTLSIEQCIQNVLDLEIPNIDEAALAKLVINIYDYFTEQETNNLTDLKQRMLDFIEFEDFPCERWTEYEAQLVKIAFCLYNIEEKTLPEFGLTATSDWKRFFIDYYKLKQVPRYDFYDCYPEIVDKVEREIEFNELEVNGDDNFDLEKLIPEWDKERTAKGRSDGGKKGGKTSKRNHTTPIRLRNLHTGNCVTFEDITQCFTYLKVSRNTIQKMKRGEKTILDNDWKIVIIEK